MRKPRRNLSLVNDQSEAAEVRAQQSVDPTPAGAPAAKTTPAAPADDSPAVNSGPRHATLYYSLARLALLLVVAGLLYLVGARGFLLLVLAFLISGLLSFVVLAPLRDAMSARLARRLTRINNRIEESKTAEDELL